MQYTLRTKRVRVGETYNIPPHTQIIETRPDPEGQYCDIMTLVPEVDTMFKGKAIKDMDRAELLNILDMLSGTQGKYNRIKNTEVLRNIVEMQAETPWLNVRS
jgi:hypothetical protein